MMAGRAFLVLAGAFQFGHGVGGFTNNFIHSEDMGIPAMGLRLTVFAHSGFYTTADPGAKSTDGEVARNQGNSTSRPWRALATGTA